MWGGQNTRALEISRLLENFSRVCISPAPQSPSPKLETTRSLDKIKGTMSVILFKFFEKPNVKIIVHIFRRKEQ